MPPAAMTLRKITLLGLRHIMLVPFERMTSKQANFSCISALGFLPAGVVSCSERHAC